MSFKPFSMNIRGRLFIADKPLIMGIVNVTPDSFYEHDMFEGDIVKRIRAMACQGADIIDIGGCSTKPGFVAPTVDEETDRVMKGVEIALKVAPECLISVDTFRSEVARKAIDAGAHIINDVSGLAIDPEMLETVKKLNVPYILTHPSDGGLTESTPINETVSRVLSTLSDKVRLLALEGIADVIVDPGFGFGKTLEQNYAIMKHLSAFGMLERPILIGVSRKSMAYKVCGNSPEEALPATIALETIGLCKGASILRAHDVEAAIQARNIVTFMNNLKTS